MSLQLPILIGRRQIWRSAGVALAFIVFFATFAPQSVCAHGEILIRIAAKTRQIEAATNNLAPLYLERGELHREHKDWEAAKTDYEKAAELGADAIKIDFCRAKLLADRGQLEDAKRLFTKVIAAGEHGEALVCRARVLAGMGETKSAANDYQRGLELLTEPQSEHFLELAQVLLKEGQTNEALRSLDKGIKKFGPIVSLQGYALDIELAQTNHNAALARLDTLVEAAVRKEKWFARRGDILLSAGRIPEAGTAFKESLAAINNLPARIRQGPEMQALQSHVNAALVKTGLKEFTSKK